MSVGPCQLVGSGNLPGSFQGRNHNKKGWERDMLAVRKHPKSASSREPEQLFGVVPDERREPQSLLPPLLLF